MNSKTSQTIRPSRSLQAGLLAATLITGAASAQNVGIGTTAPKSKLSVNGTTASGGIAVGDATYTSTTGTVAPLNGAIIQGNTGIGTVAPLSQLDIRGTTKIMATTGVPTGSFWNGTSNVNGFEVTTNIGGDVYVGIQRAGAVAPLHLAKPAGAAVGDPFALFIVNAANVGTITRTAGGVAFNTTSDERLKEHIRPSAKGLKDVMKIQVSDYNYKSAPGRDETGFIAQQLNTILPEAVAPGGENPVEKPWAVDYGRVTPVLAKAIQEQQALIGSLKAEVATLADENRQLRAQAATVAALAAKMEALEKLVQTNTGESRTAMISK
jgi:hypothetical protein